MKGKFFKSKKGGFIVKVMRKLSNGWLVEAVASGKQHHVNEHTLRRHFEPYQGGL